MVESGVGDITVSCDTGSGSCSGVNAGDVSIGDMANESVSNVGVDSEVGGSCTGCCCGGGANEDFVVGQFAGLDQQSESGGTIGVSCITGSEDGEQVFADGVALESGTDLFEVTLAVCTTGFFTGRVQCGEEHTCEDRDDSDDDEQKYNRKIINLFKS